MKNVTYLLENFDSNELSILHKLLNTTENNTQEIEQQLGKILLPSGIVGGAARFFGFSRNSLSYSEFIKKIASHNNISLSFENGSIEAEQHLYLTLFKKEFDKMSESEKDEYLNKLQVNGLDKSQIASLTAITSLGVAQASGFGVYLLASSTIGAISSAVGITLPFALYTTMSSVLSIITGPVGFLFMGVAVYKTFKDVKNIEDVFDKITLTYKGIKKVFVGDYQTATICFNYIAAMRTIIPIKYENEINQGQNKILDYEAQNEKKTVEIDKNNQQINSSKEEITTHNNEIQELQIEIDNLKTQIQNKKTQISNIYSNIKKTENLNLDLRNNIDVNNNLIKDIKAFITDIAAKLQIFITKTLNKDI